MFEFLKRRWKNEEGAMDKILVTLLLVVVGVGAVAGLAAWVDGAVIDVQKQADKVIGEVMVE